MKKLLIPITLLIALLAVAIPMASAQSDCPTTGSAVTVTYTEAQINSSFRVTNPANRDVSNVYVNLQPGQVTLSATLTWRSTSGIQTADTVVVLIPSISNGRVYWDVVSITANGQPASADLIAQINASLTTSWRRWIAEHGPAGVFTDVTVSEDDISYTYIPWVTGCTPPPSEGTSEPGSGAAVTVTYSEAQINSSFAVTNPINRNTSNIYVNLQAGQVTITATLTWRQRSGVQTANTAVVLTPTVSNGRVDWTVISASANGQPASADLVNQINASLASSWRRWIAEHGPAGVVTAVSITENDISYSYVPRL